MHDGISSLWHDGLSASRVPTKLQQPRSSSIFQLKQTNLKMRLQLNFPLASGPDGRHSGLLASLASLLPPTLESTRAFWSACVMLLLNPSCSRTLMLNRAILRKPPVYTEATMELDLAELAHKRSLETVRTILYILEGRGASDTRTIESTKAPELKLKTPFLKK